MELQVGDMKKTVTKCNEKVEKMMTRDELIIFVKNTIDYTLN